MHYVYRIYNMHKHVQVYSPFCLAICPCERSTSISGFNFSSSGSSSVMSLKHVTTSDYKISKIIKTEKKIKTLTKITYQGRKSSMAPSASGGNGSKKYICWKKIQPIHKSYQTNPKHYLNRGNLSQLLE